MSVKLTQWEFIEALCQDVLDWDSVRYIEVDNIPALIDFCQTGRYPDPDDESFKK